MKPAEISEIIKSSKDLHIGGGATRGGGDFAPQQTGIVNYAPDELLITLHAGTTMEELFAVLDKNGQMLAQEPMDHSVIYGTNGKPTIGGAIGVNADGPRRLRFGSLREALLGVNFIDGTGEYIRAGGVVMKNVTGLDITKFFSGSRGALGVALQASFKLLPKPREAVYLRFDMPRQEALQRLLPILRASLEITGAVYANDALHIRQEGELLSPLTKDLQNALGQGEPQSAENWRDLRDWKAMQDCDELWRIYTRPTLASQTADAIGADAMVLCGGSQLLVAASEADIARGLQSGQFAICEKGKRRGARLPAMPVAEEEIRAKLKAVFDPFDKFGGENAH